MTHKMYFALFPLIHQYDSKSLTDCLAPREAAPSAHINNLYWSTLAQINGNDNVVKKALYCVSKSIHQRNIIGIPRYAGNLIVESLKKKITDFSFEFLDSQRRIVFSYSARSVICQILLIPHWQGGRNSSPIVWCCCISISQQLWFPEVAKPEKNAAAQREGIRVGWWFMHPQEEGWTWPLRHLSTLFFVFLPFCSNMNLYSSISCTWKTNKMFSILLPISQCFGFKLSPRELIRHVHKLNLSHFIHAILWGPLTVIECVWVALKKNCKSNIALELKSVFHLECKTTLLAPWEGEERMYSWP